MAKALNLLSHGDLHAAEHALQKAAGNATGEMLAGINQVLPALEAGDQVAVTAALQQVTDRLRVKGEEHMESGKDEQLKEGGKHTQSKGDKHMIEHAPEEGNEPMAGDYDGL
ncbi:MAG: hypothetical protein BroJett011_13490 [Chloroflexota bacterium]|nr:MAG: hypothetical protein BroJett011_13490 [Chloroflexota bacterium]